MLNISEQFIDIIYGLSVQKMPKRILGKARDCFIDYLSVAIAGGKINFEKASKIIADDAVYGDTHVIGYHKAVDLRTATMINAFNAHVLELDDGHRFAMMHLAAPIFSSLLGVAELQNCNLNQLFHAAVIGYEAAIRLGSSIQPSHKKKGFHATGTCGAVGCALAIGSLLEYSRDEMMNVLCASATSGSGLLEVITGKSEQKPYNIAHAAVSGLDAAIYGKYFSGPEDVLGGPRGFLRDFSDGFDENRLLSSVDSYAIEGVYIKPYASCRHCHAPIEAALNLSEISRASSEEITEIRVDTYDLAVYGHDHTEINSANSAKMSIPYCVAVAYLKHQCGMEAFEKDMIDNEEILSLAKKVKVVEDYELSSLAPSKRAAVVTIISGNGEEQSFRVDYPKGEPENPMSETEQWEKFCSLAKSAGINIEQSKDIIDFVNSSGENTVSQLFQLLCI